MNRKLILVSLFLLAGSKLSANVAELEALQAETDGLVYHYTFEGLDRESRLAQKAAPFVPGLVEYTDPGRYVEPVLFVPGPGDEGTAVRTSAGGLAQGARNSGSGLQAGAGIQLPAEGTIEFLVRPELIDDQGYGIAGTDGISRWRFFQNGTTGSGLAQTTIGENVPVPLIGGATGIAYEAYHWYHIIQTWEVRGGTVTINAWVSDLSVSRPQVVQTIIDARHGHAGGFHPDLRIGSLNETLFFFRGGVDALAVYNRALGAEEIAARMKFTGGGESPLVTDLSAESRDGQVFVQWLESAFLRDDLSVFMHDEPITPENFENAELLEARLGPRSANDWFEDPAESPRTSGPARGWIIRDGGAPLDRSGGLYVYTADSDDPTEAYFAVLVEGQGREDVEPGINATREGVRLTEARIEPIWQEAGGEDPARVSAAGKPLALVLHAHTGRPSAPLNYLFFGDETMGWRAGLPFKFKVSVLEDIVVVEPYDRVWINRRLGADETGSGYNRKYKHIETWHYGTNDRIDDPGSRDEGTAVNYTERIYLAILDWVQDHYGTDPNRVYGYGTSMGTGIQRLALQNPDRFASVDLLVPFVDWSYADGVQSNAKRLQAACGPMDMMTNEGIPLGERMDLVDFVGNTTADLPHVTVRAGRNDRSVYWERKPPYLQAMQDGGHGIAAGWDTGGHGDAMRGSVEAFPDYMDFDYAIERFALDRSYPAFANFSLNEDPGNGDPSDGDPVGFINRGIDWSDVVDETDRYEVAIMVTHPDAVFPESVDVTLRNVQRFRPGPDGKVRMSNRNAVGEIVEERVMAVRDGEPLRYEGFFIDSGAGNTLVMETLEG